MGVPSLHVTYRQLAIATLTKTLNDAGSLGPSTLALLRAQLMVIGAAQQDQLQFAGRYLKLAKQLLMAEAMGISIHHGGTTVGTPAMNLSCLLSRVTCDPMALGIATAIPLSAYFPLHDLNIATLAELTCERGQ
jgi:hypothetical protein